MTVTVNGQARTVGMGVSVEGLLAELKLVGQACAVEVNKTLVPKRKHGEHRLAEGDKVEVVTLVGGG